METMKEREREKRAFKAEQGRVAATNRRHRLCQVYTHASATTLPHRCSFRRMLSPARAQSYSEPAVPSNNVNSNRQIHQPTNTSTRQRIKPNRPTCKPYSRPQRSGGIYIHIMHINKMCRGARPELSAPHTHTSEDGINGVWCWLTAHGCHGSARAGATLHPIPGPSCLLSPLFWPGPAVSMGGTRLARTRSDFVVDAIRSSLLLETFHTRSAEPTIPCDYPLKTILCDYHLRPNFARFTRKI
jgi:hypothetical protein